MELKDKLKAQFEQEKEELETVIEEEVSLYHATGISMDCTALNLQHFKSWKFLLHRFMCCDFTILYDSIQAIN